VADSTNQSITGFSVRRGREIHPLFIRRNTLIPKGLEPDSPCNPTSLRASCESVHSHEAKQSVLIYRKTRAKEKYVQRWIAAAAAPPRNDNVQRSKPKLVGIRDCFQSHSGGRTGVTFLLRCSKITPVRPPEWLWKQSLKTHLASPSMPSTLRRAKPRGGRKASASARCAGADAGIPACRVHQMQNQSVARVLLSSGRMVNRSPTRP
jgi:hypothetical protein